MLSDVKCTVLSVTSNEHFDAFVLSESSMFVYDKELILKTCGTTTLLKALPKLFSYADECNLDVISDFYYSRKNFDAPDRQHYPHINFNSEVDYLDKMLEKRGRKGGAYILGRLNGDHWYLYTIDSNQLTNQPDQTLEILMNDLDEETMKQFYCKEGISTEKLVKEISEKSGINDLIPGTIVDDFLFEPCGYSANGLNGESYWTIHVTPQKEFSYVSFETNYPFDCYENIIDKVIETFKPGKFIITLFSNNFAKCRKLPLTAKSLSAKYSRKDYVSYDFGTYIVLLSHYQKQNATQKQNQTSHQRPTTSQQSK